MYTFSNEPFSLHELCTYYKFAVDFKFDWLEYMGLFQFCEFVNICIVSQNMIYF